MTHYVRTTPKPLGVPSQSHRLISSEGPLDEEEPHDFDQYRSYQYLPVESHQVRFLSLCGGQPQAPIFGRLQALDFAEVQRHPKFYDALSYACRLFQLRFMRLVLFASPEFLIIPFSLTLSHTSDGLVVQGATQSQSILSSSKMGRRSRNSTFGQTCTVPCADSEGDPASTPGFGLMRSVSIKQVMGRKHISYLIC